MRVFSAVSISKSAVYSVILFCRSSVGTPYTSATKLRYSIALNCTNTSGLSVTYPIFCFASSGYFRISVPPMYSSPASGAMTPVIILMVVVFPAPFGPKNPKISPLFASNERLSTALAAERPYVFETFCTVSIFSPSILCKILGKILHNFF